MDKVSSSTPLDIASLRDGTAALNELSWHTNYHDYSAISNAITTRVLQAILQFQKSTLPRILGDAKAYDIITDLAFICRLGLDLNNNPTPRYSPRESPLLAFLDTGNTLNNLSRIRVWHHPPDSTIWPRIKKTAKRWITHGQAIAVAKHDDILNRNYLLSDYLTLHPGRQVDWPANLFSWREPSQGRTKFNDLTICLTETFNSLVSENLPVKALLLKRLKQLGNLLIHYHLGKAGLDYTIISRSTRRRALGLRLLSGTPKHLGRLTSFLYQQDARPVIRFAHGGERAFFVDNEWAVAELVNCDKYYTHSTGEAHAIKKRIANREIAGSPQANTIKFLSNGSSRHRHIYENGQKRRHGSKTRQALYVAGGYLGEALADFASRKPPDVLYLDWQVSLLKELRSLGYRITTKLHPRGIMPNRSLLEPYSDRVITGFFDPLDHEVDFLIFDFAGSAFFDALASHHNIILADTTIRAFDKTTKPDLLKRCKIVSASQDDRGRFRVSRDDLGNAIESTSDNTGCPPDFYKNYIAQ
ncbi:MAG: hypothetical protein CMM32_05470 [Rhodospirillaceae bacterium]|nr:hypothetical protein [Rhodospirillaceae bacterium]|tara:strand:+ start:452 stop:2038 length:1587 start_codon:yes stop_codon:yes gene_type:complete